MQRLFIVILIAAAVGVTLFFFMSFFTAKQEVVQIPQPAQRLPIGEKGAGTECREHNECTSGVCDHFKANMGKCAVTPCTPGIRSDNNNFYCANAGVWAATKKKGERCGNDSECYQPTCFMNPGCEASDIPRTKAWCTQNICTSTVTPSACEEKGWKLRLRKDQYSDDCYESMAQMRLPTDCIPCGDGTCDTTVESKCNCAEDCESQDVGLGFSVVIPAGWPLWRDENPQLRESTTVTLEEDTAPPGLPPGRMLLSSTSAQGRTLAELIPSFKKSNPEILLTPDRNIPVRTVRLVGEESFRVVEVEAYVLAYTVKSTKESGRIATLYVVSNDRLYTVALMGDMRVWEYHYAPIFEGLVTSFRLPKN